MPEELCRVWERAIEQVFRDKTPQDVEFSLPLKGGVKTLQGQKVRVQQRSPRQLTRGSKGHYQGELFLRR